MRAELRLRAVSLERERRPVLRRLEWTLRPGRVAWVLGENGTGKSTLLRALAGRLRPAGGRIEYEPRVPASRIAYAHPGMRLPPESTVADWWRLLDGLAGGAGWLEPRLSPALPPGWALGRLSTGEQKRLLLDAVLRRPADVYLLDEPYAHLAPGSKSTLTAMLRGRAAQAVVVVATNQPVGGSADERCLRLLGEAAWRPEGGA